MTSLERRVRDVDREDIVRRLEIKRKLDLIFELAEKRITWDFNSNDTLYDNLSKIAEFLPYLNEDLYIAALERGIASPKKGIQRVFYENIGLYTRLKPEEFEKMFYKVYEGEDSVFSSDFKKGLAQALDKLLPEHAEIYIRIFEKVISKKPIPYEMHLAYENLNKLFEINQEKYHEFIKEAEKSSPVIKGAIELLASRKILREEPEEEEEDISGHVPYWIEDSENVILNYLEESVNARKSSWEEKYKLQERYIEPEEFEALETIFQACAREWKRYPLDKLRNLIASPHTDVVKIAGYLDKGLNLEESFECPTIDVPAYEVIRKLGEGGFGKAYLIEHSKLGTKSVLKICGSKEALEEAKKYVVLKDKDTRNVARFEELYDENNNPITVNGEKKSAIKIEYIEGKSLREIIQEKGALDKETVKRISQGVLNGLKELNEHGLIHRDVKPENIMVANDGTVKLIDLNVTSSVEIPEEFTINRLYAAPEGRKGKVNNLNFDYWSFGLTLYEMLTGEHLIPVPDELRELGFNSRTSRYKSVVRERFDEWLENECGQGMSKEYLRKIKRLPRRYASIVRKCLTKPEKRYQTVDKIVNDLTKKSWLRKLILPVTLLGALSVGAYFATKSDKPEEPTVVENVMTPEEQDKLTVLVNNHLAKKLNETKDSDIRLKGLKRSRYNLEDRPEENGVRFLSLNGFTHFNIEHQGNIYRFSVADISPNNPEKVRIEPYEAVNKKLGKTFHRARLIVSSRLETGLMYGYHIDISQHRVAAFDRLFTSRGLNFPITHSTPAHPAENNLIVPPNIPIIFKAPSEFEFISNSGGKYYEIVRKSLYEKDFKGVDWFVDGRKVQGLAKEYTCSFEDGKHIVEIDSRKYGVRAQWEINVDHNIKPNLHLKKLISNRIVQAGEEFWFTVAFTKDSYVSGNNLYVEFNYNDQSVREHIKCENERLTIGITDVYPTTKLKFDKPGIYTVKVRLDPDNRIDESNEKDNEITANIIVE